MDVLEKHGTRLLQLKPSAIVGAARADLARAAAKRAGEAGELEPYCFHRVHVQRAGCPHELIAIALDDRRRGLASGKRMTRLVYGDQLLLARALLASIEGGGRMILLPAREG